LSGKEVLLIEATVWDLLNIPIDEAIDLFDNLQRFIRDEGKLFITHITGGGG
jgi:hypothetical protein